MSPSMSFQKCKKTELSELKLRSVELTWIVITTSILSCVSLSSAWKCRDEMRDFLIIVKYHEYYEYCDDNLNEAAHLQAA